MTRRLATMIGLAIPVAAALIGILLAAMTPAPADGTVVGRNRTWVAKTWSYQLEIKPGDNQAREWHRATKTEYESCLIGDNYPACAQEG